MPYTVISNAQGCSGYAVVKEGETTPIEGGCHALKSDAIAHMVAVEAAYEETEMSGRQYIMDDEEMDDDEKSLSLKQKMLYDLLEIVAEETGKFKQDMYGDGAHYVEGSPFAQDGLICANCVFYEGGRGCEIVEGDIDPNGICKLWIIKNDLITTEPEESSMGYEARAVNLVAPAFMRASAKRGLALHEEGYSGDGLKPQTVEDARKMANGTALSEQKWRKIAPWIARHIVDLDAVQGDEITPGLVAMLLWGGGSSKSSARRAQDYAERLVQRLENEERAPAPKEDQIFGSEKNPAGSAADKEGDITLSDAVDKSLQNKADEHNKKMSEEDKPNWTRVRVGALRSVWRRGAGAFSTSHRPGMTRQQWAMARVNAFLYLAEKGKPENVKYVQDNDLLHTDHPRYSDKEEKKSSSIMTTDIDQIGYNTQRDVSDDD